MLMMTLLSLDIYDHTAHGLSSYKLWSFQMAFFLKKEEEDACFIYKGKLNPRFSRNQRHPYNA